MPILPFENRALHKIWLFLSVVGDPLASSTHEELLEDMWFDRVMEDLSLDDSASHHRPGL